GGPRGRIVLHHRLLQRAQQVVAQRAGVLEVVEAEGRLARARHAEVLRRTADRDDEMTVGNTLAGGGLDPLLRRIRTDDAPEMEVDRRQAADDAARRIRNVLRLESRRRHLVEEGEEAVIVPAVDPERVDAGTTAA